MADGTHRDPQFRRSFGDRAETTSNVPICKYYAGTLVRYPPAASEMGRQERSESAVGGVKTAQPFVERPLTLPYRPAFPEHMPTISDRHLLA
jgi:hypothetical protein